MAMTDQTSVEGASDVAGEIPVGDRGPDRYTRQQHIVDPYPHRGICELHE